MEVMRGSFMDAGPGLNSETSSDFPGRRKRRVKAVHRAASCQVQQPRINGYRNNKFNFYDCLIQGPRNGFQSS